jgi:TusA-related sulfurtransferase
MAMLNGINARKAPYDAAHQQVVNFFNQNCPEPMVTTLLSTIAAGTGGRINSLAKGDVFEVSLDTNMIKSENGWIQR